MAILHSSAPPLRFRVATPADGPLLHSLIQSAFRDDTGAGWTTETKLLSGDRIDVAGLLAKIANPDGAVLVATTATPLAPTPTSTDTDSNNPSAVAAAAAAASEQDIACCEVTLSPSPTVGRTTAYFGLFAVAPRHQRGGVGRAVLAYAEEYCRRRWAATHLEMTVLNPRTELVEWYIRRGFSLTDEVRPFPFALFEETGGRVLMDGLALMVMRKALGGDAGGERGGEGEKLGALSRGVVVSVVPSAVEG